LDFFGGSGTTAAVAAALGRRFITVDKNSEAIEVMQKRLGGGLFGATVEFIDIQDENS
jgi:site-specific DNA-methyltransferase (adenine-specific)